MNLLDGTAPSPPISSTTPRPRVTQVDILPKAVKARHLEAGLFGIKVGLASERGDGSTYGVWFSTDTGKLSIFDGENWISIN